MSVTDEDEKVRLTAEEIALLHEAVRWRRKHDVQFFLTTSGGFMEWCKREDGKRRCVSLDRGKFDSIGVVADYYGESYEWHHVETVTQAVDLLVALGYLPPRFSSAYRAGWDARDSYEPSHESPEVLFRITGEEPRSDFPAVGPTW
jgi:hypothetical protein